MLKTLTFIRHNAIALLALFVALGGTSYAALSLPPGSVGTRQLKNRAVTAAKLNPTSIAASVRAWANLTWAEQMARAGIKHRHSRSQRFRR